MRDHPASVEDAENVVAARGHPVPTPTAVAPTLSISIASRPEETPPVPMMGIRTAAEIS
jgi:hypothetical protein